MLQQKKGREDREQPQSRHCGLGNSSLSLITRREKSSSHFCRMKSKGLSLQAFASYMCLIQ